MSQFYWRRRKSCASWKLGNSSLGIRLTTRFVLTNVSKRQNATEYLITEETIELTSDLRRRTSVIAWLLKSWKSRTRTGTLPESQGFWFQLILSCAHWSTQWRTARKQIARSHMLLLRQTYDFCVPFSVKVCGQVFCSAWSVYLKRIWAEQKLAQCCCSKLRTRRILKEHEE